MLQPRSSYREGSTEELRHLTWWIAAPCFCGMVAWRWGGTMAELGLRRNMCGEPVGEMPGLWLGLSPDGKGNVPPERNPALDKNITVMAL